MIELIILIVVGSIIAFLIFICIMGSKINECFPEEYAWKMQLEMERRKNEDINNS